ncbi:dTDP-4-amino-4,6-dideoxygalactose transaminase [Candidatus Pelagibacter sp.]|uniref:dTDP-4-amino-4,6-dideoxygalactose transaminase n=1 Tax=Candidatus Pelagibacter sp. TaxID=2024849 RepID=UPI003F82FBEE
MIPITKPSLDNSDFNYIKKVLKSKILTDGYFQNKTEILLKKLIKSKFVALTHSCTAALEISAILINLKKNDEVIMPSYGFVSVANAVVLRGAKPIFADINPFTLNISYEDIRKKISKRTKAIYVIHYAGNPCEIEKISILAKKNKIYLIEDSAHSFLGKSNNKFLGTIGDIGVFSFHETKNLVAGQGGCISINNSSLIKRANNVLDKGTDRKRFINNFRSKIIKSNNKKFYSWVDIGSEYRASELASALLYSQMLKVKKIQKRRKYLWNVFNKTIFNLKTKKFYLIKPPAKSNSAYHLFVLIFKNSKLSNNFKNKMQKSNIAATFHYVPLHKSKMGRKFRNSKLPVTEKIYNRIVRLPLFPDMTRKEVNKIIKNIKEFNNE